MKYGAAFIFSSIIGGLLLAQAAVAGLAFADCTIGYNDQNSADGYSLGYGPAEGGLDAAQRVVASCSGTLSSLSWKGYKVGSPSWNPVVKVWDAQNVVNGSCGSFGALVTNFGTSSDCPNTVIGTSNEATITSTSPSSPNSVTSTFASPIQIESGHTYFIDIRPDADTVSTTDYYGMLYAPSYPTVKSWKRGTGNGSTAYRWWPNAHGTLHVYGTVVEGAPPPPPPPPPSSPTVTVTIDSTVYTCQPQ